MAEQGGPGNQALGNGGGFLLDSWICGTSRTRGTSRTKDLMARTSNIEEEEEEEEEEAAAPPGNMGGQWVLVLAHSQQQQDLIHCICWLSWFKFVQQ